MKVVAGTLIYVCIFSAAYAEYITGDIIGDVYGISQNTIFASDAFVHFNEININAPVYIENYGQIFGAITVCDECKAYIRNNGTVHDIIDVGKNASVVQVVVSNSDITPLSINGSHELLIYQTPSMEWGDIVNLADDANAITVVNSVLYLSSNSRPYSRARIPSINLVGENELHLSMDDIVSGNPIMQNVSTQGRTRLHISDLNPLYAARAVIRDGNLYADIVREADYVKIMDNDTGAFLNALRLNNPSDNLLHKLDNARDMSQINHILHKSMRTNTRRLNMPLRTFSRHMRQNNTNEQPLFAEPFVLFGDNISAYGARGGINYNIKDKIRLSLDAYTAKMEFSDGIDDFSGDLFGINMTAQYNTSGIYARANFGSAYARLQTPALQSNKDKNSAPDGQITYITTDAGPRFTVNDKLWLAPYIGINGERAHVLHTDSDIAFRTGLIAEYKYKITDLDYVYGICITTDTRNTRYFSAHIGLIAPDDEISIRGTVGVLQDDFTHSYYLSALTVFNF